MSLESYRGFMDIYLVGGAVRDYLLGLPVKDNDYVVVGSSMEEMLSFGYKQVGADFPVFLHPETNDEYALARTESKVGEGYGGFDTRFTPDVTLEEDLARRDLTINSMAIPEYALNAEEVVQIYLVDPYSGSKDIEDKILRHTTDAFAEDPVRVLRIARFLARLGSDWTVAPETYELCQKIAWSEFKNLTAERVFLEMNKALSEPHPELFFEFLYMLDTVWFTEVFNMVGVPQPIKHHPENCTFAHTMLCLEQGVKAKASQRELFAILCHDLGKPVCWKERGNLHGHEESGLPYVESLCDRLKVPNDYRDLAMKVCRWHQYSHKILDVQPKKVHKLLTGLGYFKGTDVISSFCLCNWADASGRTGFEDREYTQSDYILECVAALERLDTKPIAQEMLAKGKVGKDIGEAIRVAQINTIRGVKNKWKQTT